MQKQLFDNADSGAEFSECGKYRYALWRIWDRNKPLIMFIGLNPSTANASKDDATIRKVKLLARRMDYGGIYMCNCFTFISKDPEDLTDFSSTGTDDTYLWSCAGKCKTIVFAWGGFDVVKTTGRGAEMERMFPGAMALIKNKDGSPRHPLYVPTKTKLIYFKN